MTQESEKGHRSWWWALPAATGLALVVASIMVATAGRTPSASAAACALTITKTADVSKVPEGGDITYTLTVKNTSTDTACTNVVVTDDINDDTDCTSTTQPAGFTAAHCDEAAGVAVTWTAATLAFNTTATLTMDVTLGSGADDGETITNTASVVSTEVTTPVVSTPATSVEVDDCDLTISKSDSPTTVAEGGEITYTIKVKNVGTADCTDLTVTDDNPSHTTCVDSSVDSTSDIDASDFDINDCEDWTTDVNLDPGDEVVLQMVVKLTSAADEGDTISNEACATSTGFADICDTETTKVGAPATATPTTAPTATARPTVQPVVPPVAPPPVAPPPVAPPTRLIAPITGSGADAGGSGAQTLALLLGLAGAGLLLVSGVAFAKRTR